MTDARTAQIARSRVAALTLPRFVSHAEPSPIVLNNMTVSANGKWHSLRLEMSREQAGNLLRKYVSLP